MSFQVLLRFFKLLFCEARTSKPLLKRSSNSSFFFLQITMKIVVKFTCNLVTSFLNFQIKNQNLSISLVFSNSVILTLNSVMKFSMKENMEFLKKLLKAINLKVTVFFLVGSK